MNINTQNIPRYAASMPVQPKFITNADKCGDHLFSQVKRHGNVCMYERHNVKDGRFCGYEVFSVKTVKAGTTFGGGSVIKSDYESYPGSDGFGNYAWAPFTKEAAENRFKKLVESKMQSNALPAGEFTWGTFAKLNKLPLDSATFKTLLGLVANGEIKETRRVTLPNGKSAGYYTKV